MLERCRDAQERWGGVHRLIDRWLHLRHELLCTFERIKDRPQVDRHMLRTFCQQLVDYVSTGHFGLYEQLIEEAKVFNDKGGLKVAEWILSRLQAITEHTVRFNDRLDRGNSRDPSWLAAELKSLGQHLQERFELEDCLIELLHNAHGRGSR